MMGSHGSTSLRSSEDRRKGRRRSKTIARKQMLRERKHLEVEPELLELADRVQADYAVVPDQFQRSGHPNFRRLQAFGTAKSTAHIGLGESSYSIYQRLNSAVEPGPK